MQRGDSIDHEAEKQSRYVTFSSTCYVYTSITHTLCVSQSQYYNTYLKQYYINSYLLIIYSCDSNYNSEKASNPQEVDHQRGFIGGVPKGDIFICTSPQGRGEEREERRERKKCSMRKTFLFETRKIYIPKEVVFRILTFTRRGQLFVCSRVCKMWRLLTSDPYPIHSFPFPGSPFLFPLPSFLFPLSYHCILFLKGCDIH